MEWQVSLFQIQQNVKFARLGLYQTLEALFAHIVKMDSTLTTHQRVNNAQVELIPRQMQVNVKYVQLGLFLSLAAQNVHIVKMVISLTTHPCAKNAQVGLFLLQMQVGVKTARVGLFQPLESHFAHIAKMVFTLTTHLPVNNVKVDISHLQIKPDVRSVQGTGRVMAWRKAAASVTHICPRTSEVAAAEYAAKCRVGGVKGVSRESFGGPHRT